MMGAGNMSIDGIDHFVVIDGKLNSIDKLKQLVVKHEDNDDVFLHEVADISFGDTDTTSFARQSDNPVVMIDIKKRSGSNVINAIDKVKMVIEEASEDGVLDGINYTYTNDQSNQIRSQVSNLENSIIFGVILVVAVLLFFLGLRNASICWGCDSFIHVYVFHVITLFWSNLKHYGSLFFGPCTRNAGG